MDTSLHWSQIYRTLKKRKILLYSIFIFCKASLLFFIFHYTFSIIKYLNDRDALKLFLTHFISINSTLTSIKWSCFYSSKEGCPLNRRLLSKGSDFFRRKKEFASFSRSSHLKKIFFFSKLRLFCSGVGNVFLPDLPSMERKCQRRCGIWKWSQARLDRWIERPTNRTYI